VKEEKIVKCKFSPDKLSTTRMSPMPKHIQEEEEEAQDYG
jgi:hypothetical protein